MTSFIMYNRDFHTMQDKPITIPWTSVSSTRFSHAQIQTGRDPKQRRRASTYTLSTGAHRRSCGTRFGCFCHRPTFCADLLNVLVL